MIIFLCAAIAIGIAFIDKPRIGVAIMVPVLFGWTLLGYDFFDGGHGTFWLVSTGLALAYCGVMWGVGVVLRGGYR